MEEKEEDKGEEVKSEGQKKDLVEKCKERIASFLTVKRIEERKKRKAGRVTTVPERDKSW